MLKIFFYRKPDVVGNVDRELRPYVYREILYCILSPRKTGTPFFYVDYPEILPVAVQIRNL